MSISFASFSLILVLQKKNFGAVLSDINQPQEDEIDLRELFFSLLQHWYVIVVTTLLTLVAAVLYLKTTLPIYSADAMLQVESKSAGSDLLLGDLAGFDTKSEVATEIEILKSRMILGTVANKLNLNIRLSPVFDDKMDKLFHKNKQLLIKHDKSGVSYIDDDQQLVVRKFEVSEGLLDKTFRLEILNPNEYQLTLMQGEEALLRLKGNQATGLDKLTSEGLIQLELNYSNMTGNRFFLGKQSLLSSSGSLAGKLSASEKGKGTGILSLRMQGVHKQQITNTLNEIIDVYVAQNLAKKSAEKEKTLEFLDKQLPEIKTKLELAESKFNAFRDTNKTIDVNKEAELLLEQSIRLGKTKLDLEQKRAELSARFTDEYPLLKQIDMQLKTVLKKKKQVNSRLRSLPSIQQEYLKLYRDVKINTELYTNLLNDYQKLKIAQSGEIGNIRVIDKAVEPLGAIKPKRNLVLLIASLLGMFLGVAIILLKKLFNTGIKDAGQLETITGLPVFANVPQSKIQARLFSKFKKNQLHRLLYIEDSQDMAIESLRSLRTALFFSISQAKNNVIMITGASPGIGKSFVSSNFAAVLAEAGKKVAVIDADLRRGHMHKYFGQDNVGGLSTLAKQNGSELLKTTLVDGLKFIPRGKSPGNPTEILMSEAFQQLITELSEENDYVLIDSPPTLAVTDANIIGSIAGSTLVVTRYGVSHVPEVKLAVDRLQASGSNVVGFIFNGVVKEAGYSYNYQYGYNYKSK